MRFEAKKEESFVRSIFERVLAEEEACILTDGFCCGCFYKITPPDKTLTNSVSMCIHRFSQQALCLVCRCSTERNLQTITAAETLACSVLRFSFDPVSFSEKNRRKKCFLSRRHCYDPKQSIIVAKM